MEQQTILPNYAAIKDALDLINYSQTIGTSILLLVLGFATFQAFRSSEEKSKILSWIPKNFGFLGMSLGIYQIVFFFSIYLNCQQIAQLFTCLRIYFKTIITPFIHFTIQPSNINKPIVSEIKPILLIMWITCIILALTICVKAYLNFQEIEDAKKSKMLLFIPISLNIFSLLLLIYNFIKFFKIDFIKKSSSIVLAENFKLSDATFILFYISIFCMIFIFRHLNKNISPSGNNVGKVEEVPQPETTVIVDKEVAQILNEIVESFAQSSDDTE